LEPIPPKQNTLYILKIKVLCTKKVFDIIKWTNKLRLFQSIFTLLLKNQYFYFKIF